MSLVVTNVRILPWNVYIIPSLVCEKYSVHSIILSHVDSALIFVLSTNQKSVAGSLCPFGLFSAGLTIVLECFHSSLHLYCTRSEVSMCEYHLTKCPSQNETGLHSGFHRDWANGLYQGLAKTWCYNALLKQKQFFCKQNGTNLYPLTGIGSITSPNWFTEVHMRITLGPSCIPIDSVY